MKQDFKKLQTLLVIVLFINTVSSQTTLKTTELNIFKNGSYFVVKEGEPEINNSEIQLPVPQNALMGTYWLTTTKDYKIQRIDFYTDTIKKQTNAKLQIDFLKANKGKKVKLFLGSSGNDQRTISGTLLDVLPTGIVKVKSGNGAVNVINSSKIYDFMVEEGFAEQFTKDSLALIARIQMNRKTGKAPLKLSYMQTKMSWIPSYNIKLINDKQLQLELKAVIENFSEEINDAEVTVTVGNPNMKFGFKLDPIATNKPSFQPSLDDEDGRIYSTFTVGKSAEIKNFEMAGDSGIDYDEFQEYTTSGEKTNDLYMYKLGKLSMKKNAKYQIPIFSSTFDYEDVYEVNLNDYVNYRSKQIINKTDGKKFFDVYHALRITNNQNQPFTTAVVFVQDEKLQPLAQDEISYTPTGGKVKVQLSKAVDVLVSNEEEEKSKEERSIKVEKSFYNKITIKGQIKIENNQKKSITLNCSKNLNGKGIKASDNGKINIPGKYSALNAQTQIDWSIKLAGGESKTIDYEYETYIYSGF